MASLDDKEQRAMIETFMFHALISNSFRAEYWAEEVTSGRVDQDEKTKLEIANATELADALIKSQKERGLI